MMVFIVALNILKETGLNAENFENYDKPLKLNIP